MQKTVGGVSFSAGRHGFGLHIGSRKHQNKVYQAQEGDDPAESREGKIAAGIALGVIGAGLIASASTGIPPVDALHFSGVHAVDPGLLHGALRFLGCISLWGAADQILTGEKHQTLRGLLGTGGGVAGMAAAAGLFGPIGGLTQIFLAIGGFLTAWGGISTLASPDKPKPN